MSDEPVPAYLITGATGGIGRALCRVLAGRGAALALAARGADRLGELADELRDAGAASVSTRSVDVRDAGAVRELVEEAADAFADAGGLAGAAHLVGSILLKPGHLTTDDEWSETLDLNLTSAFHLLRPAVRALSKRGGAIVFVSSAAARQGLKNHEAMAAAKGGLEALTRSAAATYAGRGIRVNCVAPGLVDTPLAARITGNDKALEASRALHPLGRIGRPKDVARAVAWFLDPDNDWVTGQVIGVDGGLADLKTG